MNKLFVKAVWAIVAAVCGICCAGSMLLALTAKSAFCFYISVFLASFFSHFIIMFLSAPFVQAVFRKSLNFFAREIFPVNFSCFFCRVSMMAERSGGQWHGGRFYPVAISRIPDLIPHLEPWQKIFHFFLFFL